MKIRMWLVHAEIPPHGELEYIVEASRPSVAMSRAGRYIEDHLKGTPRLTAKENMPGWGTLSVYRLPPELVPRFKGKKLGTHIWEARGPII